MSTRTVAQLAMDFPIDTTPHLASSIAKFDSLVNQGFIGDSFEVNQILGSVGGALDALAETFAAPTAVFTGSGGQTERNYKLAPTYPLEVPMGSAANNAGRYLNALPGDPPGGRPQASAVNSPENAQDQRTRRYGKLSPATSVSGTNPTLDADNYVTITGAAVQNVPGVTFDVLVDDGSGTFEHIGNVAAGATFKDEGQARTPYAPYAHAEVGYDAAQPAGFRVVYGPKTYPKGS